MDVVFVQAANFYRQRTGDTLVSYAGRDPSRYALLMRRAERIRLSGERYRPEIADGA
ncbi:hypothetical protein RvY_02842 [Ramazzottius varieornatus]|uniref:Uncharacterized protein n=1 Tax=Ramazzottius varieornatus TaxID=947166 RepID=A0A1D1UPV3_RAMVA|nr:hypothetical protein RvY_02842 [Ramazzottius varieornatus]